MICPRSFPCTGRVAGAALALLATGVFTSALASDTAHTHEVRSSRAVSRHGQNIAGVWWATGPTATLLPLTGGEIPFTAAGRAAYDKNRADLRDHKVVDKARHVCLPQGTPRVMTTRYPFEIVQTPGQVTLLFEENRIFQSVRLAVSHADPETWDPSFMGEAIGHWDDNTLVVNTTNFKPDTWLDDSGLPHSDQLVVDERFSRVGDGSVLQDLITITDPANYAGSWTARITYKLQPALAIRTDWVCGETHRDLSGMPNLVLK